MAQYEYRIDLENADFPLLSSEEGRTVISPKSEEVYHKIINKPYMYFCQNVMPYTEGYRSVSFKEIIPATTTTFISDIRIIYCTDRTRAYMAIGTDRKVYILGPSDTTWKRARGVTISVTNSEDITVGTVNGISYIYNKQKGCYKYDYTTNAFSLVDLVGLVATDILGVAASSGYLLAYSEYAFYWSSLLIPSDFTPSQVTGAGGGNVSEIDGKIKFAVASTTGVYIYATANVVSATSTGNKQYPFKLKEIIGSKGGITLDLVAYEANSDQQFVFTTAGMMTISSTKAVTVLPEVTDFLAGKYFEDFDQDALSFTTTLLDENTTMRKKVKLIGTRYLVISYGIYQFTHAIIYDIPLKKMGKVKFTHVDVIEYIVGQTEIAKENICFLTESGRLVHMDFSSGDGVMVLGKLQASRTRMTTLLGVEVENCTSGTLYTAQAITGKLITEAVEGTPVIVEPNLKSWAFRITAKNHSIILIGDFKVNSMLITYILNGRR